jgi:hypothetical protein
MALAALVSSTPAFAQSVIRGTVYDSVHARPLAGALVTIEGDTVIARSDARGQFVLPAHSAGRRRVMLSHPMLDSLGLFSLQRVVDVSADRLLILATPSSRTVLEALCARVPGDSAVLHGVIRDAHGKPVDAELRVSWLDVGVDASKQLHQRRVTLSVAATGGSYAACGLPVDMVVEVELRDAATDGRAQLTLDASTLVARQVDFVLPDSTAAPAQLRGRVTAGARGVAGATVMAGAGAESRTDSSGQFLLPKLVPGSRMLQVQAVGFAPVSRLVHLVAGEQITLDIGLERVTTLGTVRTDADRDRNRAMFVAAFETRRLSGLGRVRDSTDIERLSTTASIFDAFGGVRVQRGAGSLFTIKLPQAQSISGGNGTCEARLLLSGVAADWIDLVPLSPADLAWVEVYPRATALPAEFQISTKGRACGVVAVVTKDRIRR